jgi:signal transduction histidine kinase
VAGLSLLVTALLSRQAIRTEFLRLESSERAARLGDAASVLEAWARQTGSLAGADSVLARLRRAAGAAGAAGSELILVDASGAVIAASAPQYRDARVAIRPDGRIEITATTLERGERRTGREILIGLPRASIRGPDGALRATLLRVPARDPFEALPAPRFITSVNRWLLLAALASAVLAILLAVTLSRRILGPVEALTRAVRRMEQGDLGQRVPVRSSDEIAELSRAFNGMAASIEGNDAARRRLLTDVAHELRSPLANLRCQVEAVEDGLAKADAATMSSLHEEILLLGRLVDDIQDLSLAEAGRLPLHREHVDSASALEAARAAFAPLAAERRVSLRADAAGVPPVDADPARLQQVLRNLLANALAHTPQGGEVSVDARAEEGRVVFTVRDTGPGIPPDQLPRIFERFYRGDDSRARATGGSGLGLAIVKELVTSHGGTVSAASEPGRGAVFSFTLPAAPAS